MNTQFIQKFQLTMACIIMVVGLVACSKAVDHEPEEGEYGKKLLKSIVLSDEKIGLLNAEDAAKPWFHQTDDGKVSISFQGYSEESPYRFLIVAQGHAVTDDEVDVQFLGGVQPMETSDFTPRLYYEEDTSSYTAGEPVLLVLAAEPFSIKPGTLSTGFVAHGGLSKRDNFQFERIELQIWQGVGTHKSPVVMYLLVALLVGVLLVGGRFATVQR